MDNNYYNYSVQTKLGLCGTYVKKAPVRSREISPSSSEDSPVVLYLGLWRMGGGERSRVKHFHVAEI